MGLCCPICEGGSRFCSTLGCKNIEVGNIVEAIKGVDPLHCGSGIYKDAVVISVKPFILSSRETDMRWSHFPIENLKVVGKASKKLLKKCMRRLEN